MHPSQHPGDLARQSTVDIADKPKRDVVVLWIDPARSGETAAHHGERLGDGGRNFEAGEQAGHDKLQLVIRLNRQNARIAAGAQPSRRLLASILSYTLVDLRQ